MSTPAPLTPAPAWSVFTLPDESTLDLERLVIDPRFRAIEVLGRGGMGCVVLCEDRVLRSRAAVKILLAQDRDSRQRFREEATLLANLRHPHLVQVLTVGETEDGAPYMAMEHLGSSLAEKLADGEPLPWQEVVESARQVAAALTALHRAGVVHRDVKPENIVALRGVTGLTFVKLIDLGVARIEDLAEIQAGGEPHPPRRRTEEGRALGTRGYWPPEAGLLPPSPSFDLYSLGVTIYRLCTGILPSPIEPRTMREARPDLDLPPALDALVERAMSVRPEDRPASAASFGRELESITAAAAHGRPPALLFDGCYELLELLGIGAKAEVYRAYHRDARRYVALKILREEVVEDLEERRRFDREVRILASLRHPVLPALKECRTGPQRRRPFIAMELRRGERAADIETLPIREVVELGRQLAGALAVMRAAGIIHRDLNRTNVLIERFDDGRAPRASIIDFGQADLTDAFYTQADERYPTRPELRVVLGSGGLERADWTAPEARAGHGWSTASDVYSLGLLLHLLLTGKRPELESPGVWRSPAERVPECQGPLAEAILGALQIDPERRLDAVGLVDCLEWAAPEFGGFNPEPEPDPKPKPEPAPTRRAMSPRSVPSEPTRRWLTGFGVVVGVVVALAVWAIDRELREANRSELAGFARAARAAAVTEARLDADESVEPMAGEGAGATAAKVVDLPAANAAAAGPPEDGDAEPGVPRSTSTSTPDKRRQRLPSMRKALRNVENGLRACSRLADGLLLVEFSTDGSERFAAVTPVAETDAALLGCVRRATANIRFTPTRRPKFTEEYRP